MRVLYPGHSEINILLTLLSQSMPPIGNGISAAAPVDHAMPQTTLGFGFDARSIAAMPHIVSSSGANVTLPPNLSFDPICQRNKTNNPWDAKHPV